MSLRLEIGAWRVGVADDVTAYVVAPRGDDVARSISGEVHRAAPRAACVVEVLHRISGMRPHALLAGTFDPLGGDRLLLEVTRGGAFDLTAPPATGPLGLSITVGLPPELAEAAAEGFVTSPGACPVPAGAVRIVGGGIDHDSSPMAFLRCAAVLREAMFASVAGKDRSSAIELLIASW
jgi:hypothetical protein